MMMGTCSSLVADVAYPTNTEDGCLSACLDTAGCRGVTISHGGGTCTLHKCDMMVFGDVLQFIVITCKRK